MALRPIAVDVNDRPAAFWDWCFGALLRCRFLGDVVLFLVVPVVLLALPGPRIMEAAVMDAQLGPSS